MVALVIKIGPTEALRLVPGASGSECLLARPFFFDWGVLSDACRSAPVLAGLISFRGLPAILRFVP